MQICRHPFPPFPRYAKLKTNQNQPKSKPKAEAEADVRPEAARSKQLTPLNNFFPCPEVAEEYAMQIDR
jgi:hypothetical protein